MLDAVPILNSYLITILSLSSIFQRSEVKVGGFMSPSTASQFFFKLSAGVTVVTETPLS